MEKLTMLIIVLMLIACLWVTTSKCEAQGIPINLDIIAQIESSGNPMAVNERTGATGMYQIMPVCLEDYNKYHKGNMYTIKEMYDQAKARIVSDWYLHVRVPQLLRSQGVPVTLEHVLYAYNAGAGTVSQWYKGKRGLPKETIEYYQKYLTRKR